MTLLHRARAIVANDPPCTYSNHELRAMIARLCERQEKLEAALRPFADLPLGPLGYCSLPLHVYVDAAVAALREGGGERAGRTDMSVREAMIDGIRYAPADDQAIRVTIYGMYDCHLFHRITGASVDEIIANWQQHNREKHPARFESGGEVDDLGKSMLCPATVFNVSGREIRRVGQMVFENERGLEEYRQALSADPDIPRLLAAHEQAEGGK